MNGDPGAIAPVTSTVPEVVSYTLTRWERFRTLLRMQTRSRVLRIIVGSVFLFTVWLAFKNGEGDSLPVRVIAGVFQLAFVGAALVASLVLTALLTAFLTTDRSNAGPITLTFSDDGLFAENAVAKTSLKWAGLHSILAVGGFIYIRIADSKYIAIPERALPDARSAARLAASLRTRVEAAKKKAPPLPPK